MALSHGGVLNIKGVKIKVIKIYKNGTIRLPKNLLKHLNIKPDSYLVIDEKSYGFILCRLDDYNTFLGQFEADMVKFDKEIREASKSFRNLLSGMLNKEPIKDQNVTKL